jgi:thioredoxin 1
MPQESKIIHVDDINHYLRLIQKEQRVVVLDFSATWCGPCKKLLPTLEKWGLEHENEVLILKFDADHDKDLEEDLQVFPLFEVESLPTILFVKNQEMVKGTEYRIEGIDIKRFESCMKKLMKEL